MVEITDYRAQLYDYLKNRMLAVAPNLTVLVGELVGARLIAHAGNTLLYTLYDAGHEKIDLKVFVVVIPKEGWVHVAAPILLLV